MTRKLALSMLVLAAACGGGGDAKGPGPGTGTGTGTGPATVSDYCTQYWTGLASRWAACERGSSAYYAAIYAPALRCHDMVQAVAAGRATYDSGHAGACLSHVETASCYALEDLLAGTSPQTDCLAAVAGKGAATTACYSNESCASGLCWGAPGTCPSTCVTPLGQGGDCSSGLPCARGLSCDTFASSTCQPRKAQTATCFFDEDCQPGLRCDYSGGALGACQPRRTAGGACSVDADCATGYECGAGKTCVLREASGDACTQGTNACGPGLWCGSATSGTCVDGPTVAQGCSSVGGELRSCIGGWCSSGTCTAWLAESATCSTVPAGQCEPTAACVSSACKTLCSEP